MISSLRFEINAGVPLIIFSPIQFADTVSMFVFYWIIDTVSMGLTAFVTTTCRTENEQETGPAALPGGSAKVKNQGRNELS